MEEDERYGKKQPITNGRPTWKNELLLSTKYEINGFDKDKLQIA